MQARVVQWRRLITGKLQTAQTSIPSSVSQVTNHAILLVYLDELTDELFHGICLEAVIRH